MHHHAQLINAIIPAPVDVPQWFNASKTIVQLVRHTLNGAQLVQHLMFKLQILPLTKSSSLALLETFGHIIWEEIVPGILNTCCFASFISSSFIVGDKDKWHDSFALESFGAESPVANLISAGTGVV